MGNWNDVLTEIQQETNRLQQEAASVIDTVRRRHLQKLHDYTKRNIIAYYSGWLSKPRVEGIDIVDDDKNAFMNCIHGLDRSKGLDLLLHTPGGDIAATESIVHYLREMFGSDIRAIVPQIAMSAGTMLACSCSTILMGKESNLGPIDPHIHGIPADVVVNEFRRAFEEIKADPQKAHVWSPILSRYTPSFLTQCEYALAWSKKFVRDCLTMNMFSGRVDAEEKADAAVRALSSAELNKTHSKHLHYQELKSIDLKIQMLEDDQELQNLVLTVHHSMIHTTSLPHVIKIIENHEGRAIVKNANATPPAFALGLGAPPVAPLKQAASA
ncbi:MAG TPA: hypothetical protein VL356_13825 [Acidocella sp.]|jgi:hypothetical protein|nr:hypothetical protein [Acidocella sp.]